MKTFIAKFETSNGSRYMTFFADNKELAVDHANHVAAANSIKFIETKMIPAAKVNQAALGLLSPRADWLMFA